MIKDKPTITRYYKNLRTGQYCELQGSRQAIKSIETFEWPKFQKVQVKRISKREFKANTPTCILGYGMEYHPNYTRRGKSEIRKGHIHSKQECSIYYYPY